MRASAVRLSSVRSLSWRASFATDLIAQIAQFLGLTHEFQCGIKLGRLFQAHDLWGHTGISPVAMVLCVPTQVAATTETVPTIAATQGRQQQIRQPLAFRAASSGLAQRRGRLGGFLGIGAGLA
jgi:hypothetical protein